MNSLNVFKEPRIMCLNLININYIFISKKKDNMIRVDYMNFICRNLADLNVLI